jgi:hypothetical protein
VELVVSLTNVGTTAAATPHWAWPREYNYAAMDGVITVVGHKATDYHLLVRDAAGNPVPMTSDGRAWLQKQEPCGQPLVNRRFVGEALLRPGESIGFVLPLDRLFPLQAGKEYTALVVLPGKYATDPVWVSPLVKIKVPTPGIPGVDRPPYGSDRMWDRLLPMAGLTRFGVQMRTVISFAPAGCVNMRLQANAPGNENARSGLNMTNSMVYCSAILIRDSHGAPVLTNGDDGCSGGFCGFTTTANTCDTDLSASYHFIPGERYSLLAAVGVNHNHTGEALPAESLLVAPPVTFVAPAENAISRRPGSEFAEEQSPLAVPPAPRPTLSAQQRWDLFSRFAGKPFKGLVLEASVSKSRELLVALRNCGTQKRWPASVTKWSGQSDYEILVRDPHGKFLELTDKGKTFFRGGKTLDGQALAKGETIKATLPIGELFEMRAPGEYTVLASLPVIGHTIDAVLTAAPVKIRIDAPKAEPRPKK